MLANRFSADGKHSVLVLEGDGADSHSWVSIPAGTGKKLSYSRFVWPYCSEPEAELNGQSIYRRRGRMVERSRSFNGLIFVRGDAHRYDEWRDGNNLGWGFDCLLP